MTHRRLPQLEPWRSFLPSWREIAAPGGARVPPARRHPPWHPESASGVRKNRNELFNPIGLLLQKALQQRWTSGAEMGASVGQQHQHPQMLNRTLLLKQAKGFGRQGAGGSLERSASAPPRQSTASGVWAPERRSDKYQIGHGLEHFLGPVSALHAGGKEAAVGPPLSSSNACPLAEASKPLMAGTGSAMGGTHSRCCGASHAWRPPRLWR